MSMGRHIEVCVNTWADVYASIARPERGGRTSLRQGLERCAPGGELPTSPRHCKGRGRRKHDQGLVISHLGQRGENQKKSTTDKLKGRQGEKLNMGMTMAAALHARSNNRPPYRHDQGLVSSRLAS